MAFYAFSKAAFKLGESKRESGIAKEWVRLSSVELFTPNNDRAGDRGLV